MTTPEQPKPADEARDLVLRSGAVSSCNDLLECKIQTALKRISSAIEATKPIAVFGLFSGGHDSVSATAIASLHPRFTSAIHINTGIGVARTRQYVRETSATKGWPLKEYEAATNVNAKGKPDPQIYRALVLKYGFPGPDGHGMMYARLKERCLRMLQREWKASGRKKAPRRVMYISGCRSDESERRMANTEEVQVDGQRIWCAPIHDWTKCDTSALMQYLSIERNPIVDLIHKSGECLCGAFAQPGELEELKLWPETRPAYDEIKSLQLEVLAAGFPWGWEDAPPRWFQEKKRGQGFMLNYDQHLCWSCNKNFARGQAVTTRNDQPGMPTRADGDGVTQTPRLHSNTGTQRGRDAEATNATETRTRPSLK